MFKKAFEWARENGKIVLRKVLVEDLEKMPVIPDASSVVQRLRDASEKGHQRSKKIWDRLRNGKHGKNL